MHPVTANWSICGQPPPVHSSPRVLAPSPSSTDIVGAMPPEMVSAGLFGPHTIEWRERALRPVSLGLVAKALGARMSLGARELAWRWVGSGCASPAGLLLGRRARSVDGPQGGMLTLRSGAKSCRGSSKQSASHRITDNDQEDGPGSGTVHVQMHATPMASSLRPAAGCSLRLESGRSSGKY